MHDSVSPKEYDDVIFLQFDTQSAEQSTEQSAEQPLVVSDIISKCDFIVKLWILGSYCLMAGCSPENQTLRRPRWSMY